MLTLQSHAPTNAARTPLSKTLRLAVLCDYAEEQWPSMDLCAAMLLEQTQAHDDVAASRVCPAFRRRFGRLPGIGRAGWASNGDRFLNRHWDYPRYVRSMRETADVFHICDHSYSQLAHALPAGRTGVLCHDIDAFRCLVEPERERRPRWFRWMMRRVLTGMQKAAVVFHTTQAVKQDLLRFGLVDGKKLVQAPLGFAAEFHDRPEADAVADGILADLAGRPFLLHVGTCIPRKRVDFLLRLFAELRRRFPDLHLVKVGGSWQPEHIDCIQQHGLAGAIRHVHGIERSTLAALYRNTSLLMIPSDSEGFGLPALEGLACGAPVLVSDIPVFREVGGDALLFAPPLALDAWLDQATQILAHASIVPTTEVRLAQARKYSWAEHTRIVLAAYRELAP